mmetsp:Transcript_71065/g.117688  ORF Transcript_71065/g.117688 Transcript_71065/m.117688 type:complete len:102 (+) Transcript_71065:66-371(+)
MSPDGPRRSRLHENRTQGLAAKADNSGASLDCGKQHQHLLYSQVRYEDCQRGQNDMLERSKHLDEACGLGAEHEGADFVSVEGPARQKCKHPIAKSQELPA